MSLVSRTDISEGVAVVALTRPEKRNAINADLADELAAAVDQMAADGVVSAVLSAVGPVFCAGADMSDMSAAGPAVDKVLEVLTGHPIHWTVKTRQPVLGAGLGILAACPLVIASWDATFGLPEMARGFFPTDMMSGQIAVLGARRAFQLALSAEVIDAEHALRWGMVSLIASEEHVDDLAVSRASSLAAMDRDALRDGVAQWQAHIRSKIIAGERLSESAGATV